MEYKENIAIFTTLSGNHVYDRKLYNQIVISVPIDIKKIDVIDIEDLKEIVKEIDQSKDQNKIIRAEKLYSQFERVYKNISIDKINYFESEYGKLHMYELYMILNEILVA